MTCPHQTRAARGGPFNCALGLYGGKPYAYHCSACIAARENTPATIDALEALRARTHPPDADPTSGCCDPPDGLAAPPQA
jgi:hypothetical protein